MKYPFDADEVIAFVESQIGKELNNEQKSMYRCVLIPGANNLTEFNDKTHVSEIPLLQFDSAKIKCKYPNLYAEYIATGFHIEGLAQTANVTKELMDAVFEGNEQLTWTELKSVYLKLLCFSTLRYAYGYISSPKLSLVIPGTNKTTVRMRLLCDAVSTVDKLTNSGTTLLWRDREKLDQAREVINQVCNQRKAVPIAFYRVAMTHIQSMVYQLQTPTPRRESNMGRK